MKKLLTGLAAAAIAFSAVGTAQATQLVVNPGFETGDFTGWTQGGNTTFNVVANSHTFSGDTTCLIVASNCTNPLGNFTAFLGPVGTTGTLSQVLHTVPGLSYTIHFELANLGTTPNSFKATFGSDVIYNVANVTPTTLSFFGTTYLIYNDYSNTFTATSSSTPLTFTFVQSPSYWVLDNVTVDGAVPEPATWAMMLFGFGVIGFGLRSSARRIPRTA